MVAQMADAVLSYGCTNGRCGFALVLRSVSGTYAFALTGRRIGMDGITQGAAPLLRLAPLALGYALLPLQGGSPSMRYALSSAGSAWAMRFCPFRAVLRLLRFFAKRVVYRLCGE